MVDKVPMTVEGFEQLKKELERLKSVERPRIVKEIEVARAHGDLSENAEYQYAKEQQGLIEARIREIEDKLARAQVIDVTKVKTDKVVFGSTVTIYEINEEKEYTYKIVGDDEADISKGKISISAPIARGLIGKEEGDEVKIKTPGGVREFEIVKIEYK